MKVKRVLALSPHTDDAEIGAGGTIAKLIEQGSEVTCFAFWGPGYLEKEFAESMKILGVDDFEIFDFVKRRYYSQRQEILQLLYDYDVDHDLDLIFTPATTDVHQDHQVITNEALRAFKASSILGYEIPRNNIAFTKTCFSPLNQQHVEKKIQSLMCYSSQREQRSNRFNEELFRADLIAKGPFVDSKFAEAFEVIKVII